MFVHRVAGPSRLSGPSTYTYLRCRKTTVLVNTNVGCFVVSQRHMSRARQNPNMQTADPNQRKKKDPTDMEDAKKQGKQMAKMGKRGQERKPIDDMQFPTLDVALVEPNKFPRLLYFPYMPRRLRDWPMFSNFHMADIFFTVIAPTVLTWRFMKRAVRPSHWISNEGDETRVRAGRVIPSVRSTSAWVNQIMLETKQVLALPPPRSSKRRYGTSKPVLPTIAAPGTLSSPGAVIETEASGITIVERVSSLPERTQPQPKPSVLSRKYWRAVRTVLLRQNPSLQRAQTVLASVGSRYHGAVALLQRYWTWRYLDPGYWSPQRRKEVTERLRQVRLDAWKGIILYMHEAERHGKEAREYYQKILDNDRRNWDAMSLIASKNRFPDFIFPYFQLADRGLQSWFSVKEGQQRRWENKHFKDISSPDSPVSSILEDAKAAYVEMNRAVAEGKLDGLRAYAGKRYLNELEKRTAMIAKNGKSVVKNWRFEGWGAEPECISIRAKDFFASYPGAHDAGGGHLVVNMLVKFDSWQSLDTRELHRSDRRHMNRGTKTKHERRHVVEYLVLDFRTWVWRAKPKFIQQVYPGQKLDVITYEMSEEKMMEAMKKKNEEEMEDEEETGREGKVALPSA